jgi:energy-coupling factor transport system permease protein
VSGDGPVAYRPGDSALHRLHPVTTLLATGYCVVAAYLAPSPVVVGLLVLVLSAAVVAGVAVPVLRGGAAVLAPLGLALLVLRGFFTAGDGTVLARLGPVTLWAAGARIALTTFLTLAAFVLAGLLFVAVTHPGRLSAGLAAAGVPRGFGYVLVSSLRLVPELRERAYRVIEAQRARGLDTGGGPRERGRALLALLGPLFVGAIVSAQTRSLALEARGFSSPGPRTSLHDVSTRPVDHAVRVGGLLALLALVAWRLRGVLA